MSGHRRWAQKMMARPMPLTVELEEQAADRERRRIRTAQREALKRLRQKVQEANRPTMFNEIFTIDAATRAKKGKRK